MSVVTGYVLACAVVVIGACSLAAFAFWLGAREAREQSQRASRSVILRAVTYRPRRR